MGLFLRSRTRPTPLLDLMHRLEKDMCVECGKAIGNVVGLSWVELGGGLKCCLGSCWRDYYDGQNS